MSRIEKAIESANLKRSRETENRPDAESPPLLKIPQTKRQFNYGQGLTTNVGNPYLVTANDINSPAAEQYRKLKSLLVQRSQSGLFGNALMVTSAVPGEGKTITSLNLAITMAQEFDHTVLLVEADIRKPSILSNLGITPQRGLVECVLDNLDISDVLIKTDIGNLSILPAGRQVENPVEVFSSNRMSMLFEDIKCRYKNRYVIVDTTPLLPFAEPQYIAKAIGAVLFVVREGKTTPNNIKRSLEILKNNTLLGVVSNCVSRVNILDGYNGYYGYRY